MELAIAQEVQDAIEVPGLAVEDELVFVWVVAIGQFQDFLFGLAFSQSA